jgi:predicted nucleic acid-binding Zn ribbon protein
MPTYVYRREDGTDFEIEQRISDAPLTHDPETGQPVRRVISGKAGLVFKGSGFYLTDYTDYGKGGSKKADAKEGADASKGDAAKTDTKAGVDASFKTESKATTSSDAKPSGGSSSSSKGD